ncbi:class I SAM-dependent methyltransferase [Candidatus Uhrbacteria bacterium]|nr:class I SAM-dependent methyltransferase [Candidatus Uhrbacteria bacterium]
MSASEKTSWGNVANWYDQLVDGQSSNYQKDLILPNLLRCLELKPEQRLLDLACGQGFFTRAFSENGAHVMGMDISEELIQIAKKNESQAPKIIPYIVGSAEDLSVLPASARFELITIVLAIQNISQPHLVFKACSERLMPGGRLVLVLNHPAFRIPKSSEWGWDDKKQVQYRRIERYSSEFSQKMQMHPGSQPEVVTYTYHRPLQYFIKHLVRAGFVVSNLEEWVSHKQSDSGPRALAENMARREIPIFLYLEAKKI